jgi:hypothetical protein
MILGKHIDQIYPSKRKLCRKKDSHSKVSLWKVAGGAENQESQSLDRFAGIAIVISYASMKISLI